MFHPKVLLILLNICSYRTDELGNGIGRIYYIALSETRKKLSCYNENIQHCCFKKLGSNIERKLKFNGANNSFTLLICPSVLRLYLPQFIFMKRIKITRSEMCDVMWRHHCLHKKLDILFLYDYDLRCVLENTLLEYWYTPPASVTRILIFISLLFFISSASVIFFNS